MRVDTGAVLGELLRHEMHYWQGRAREAGLFGGRDGLSMGLLVAGCRAAGCLLGVSTAAELARAGAGGGGHRRAEALWLRELYLPGLRTGNWVCCARTGWRSCTSAASWTSLAELARACLTGLDQEQARRALVLLARASAEHAAARVLLESSLALRRRARRGPDCAARGHGRDRGRHPAPQPGTGPSPRQYQQVILAVCAARNGKTERNG